MLAAAAGWNALPGTSLTGPLMAAAVAAGIAAATAQLVLRVVAPTLVAAGVVAVATAAAVMAVRLGAGSIAAATASAAVAIVGAPLLPRVALRLAGLPRPVVPADGSELTDDDAGLPAAELAERGDLARGYLAGLTGGAAAIASVGALFAASGGGWFGPVFAAVTAVVLLLRARGYADAAPARTALGAAVATAVGLAVILSAPGFTAAPLACVVLLLGAAAGIAALDASTRGPPLRAVTGPPAVDRPGGGPPRRCLCPVGAGGHGLVPRRARALTTQPLPPSWPPSWSAEWRPPARRHRCWTVAMRVRPGRDPLRRDLSRPLSEPRSSAGDVRPTPHGGPTRCGTARVGPAEEPVAATRPSRLFVGRGGPASCQTNAVCGGPDRAGCDSGLRHRRGSGGPAGYVTGAAAADRHPATAVTARGRSGRPPEPFWAMGVPPGGAQRAPRTSTARVASARSRVGPVGRRRRADSGAGWVAVMPRAVAVGSLATA